MGIIAPRKVLLEVTYDDAWYNTDADFVGDVSAVALGRPAHVLDVVWRPWKDTGPFVREPKQV